MIFKGSRKSGKDWVRIGKGAGVSSALAIAIAVGATQISATPGINLPLLLVNQALWIRRYSTSVRDSLSTDTLGLADSPQLQVQFSPYGSVNGLITYNGDHLLYNAAAGSSRVDISGVGQDDVLLDEWIEFDDF